MMADTLPTGTDPTELLATLLKTLDDAIHVDTFSNEGQILLKALIALAIAIMAVRQILTHAPLNQVIADLVMLVFVWGFASYIIDGSGGENAFIAALDNGFTTLANKLMGDSASLPGALGRMLQSAASLFDGTSSSSNWKFDIWNPGETSGAMLAALAQFIFRIFIAVLILITGLLYAGQYILTQLTFKLGWMMAPIMVPWIVFEPTNFVFNGWVRFMVTAGMQKVVGAAMLAATLGVLDKANELAKTAGNDAVANFYIYAAVLLMVGIMSMLMQQTVSIANGLLSGSAMGKYNAPAKLTPGGAMNAGSGVLGAAGAGAKRAGGVVVQKVAGLVKGKGNGGGSGSGSGSGKGSAP